MDEKAIEILKSIDDRLSDIEFNAIGDANKFFSSMEHTLESILEELKNISRNIR